MTRAAAVETGSPADPRSPWSRRTLSLVFAALVALCAMLLAPSRMPELVFRCLTDGLLLLAWLAAAWGWGRWLGPWLGTDHIATRDASLTSDQRVPATAPDATLRLVTHVALGLGVWSILVLLLGCAGGLSRITAVTVVIIGLVNAIRCVYNNRKIISAWFSGPAGGTWLALLAAPSLAVICVGGLIVPGLLWGDEPNGYDVVAYHLQIPREWYELGRIVPLRHNVFSFFPFNVEMHSLLAMHLRGGAYAGMYLAQLMHGTFMALTIAAVYGTARVHGRLPAAAAAVICACVPWTPMLGSVAYNEGGLMLYSTLAAAWALRGRWALAGACAGLAAGCKLTGVATAIMLVPLAAVLSGSLSLWERVRVRAKPPSQSREAPTADESRAVPARDSGAVTPRLLEQERSWPFVRPSPSPSPRGRGSDIPADDTALDHSRSSLRGVARFALCATIALSPWLIRNALWSGNPLFPIASSRLGHAHFDAGQTERFDVAHSPRPDQQTIEARLHALNAQVIAEPRYASIPLGDASIPVLLLIGIAGTAIAWRRRETWMWVALIIGNVVFWLLATHLQGRFLVQAVPILAILGAGMSGRFRWWPAVTAAAVVVVGALSIRASLAKLTSLQAVMGADNLRGLHDETIERWLFESDRPIVLVGDAKAFLYPIPMSRLRYRGVFDVPSGTSFRDAWLGSEVPADAIVIIDPGELERFGRTYRNLPAVPAAFRGRPEPFVIEASAVP